MIDRNGDPSSSLRNVLLPEIRVKRVVYQGIGQCEDMTRPEVPKVSTQEPKSNFPPLPRNQVDLVNATVGQLLVFKVPEVLRHISLLYKKSALHNIYFDINDFLYKFYSRILFTMQKMVLQET